MILCSSCQLQFVQLLPLATLYQRRHKSAMGVWVDHDYSDLVTSSLGHSIEKYAMPPPSNALSASPQKSVGICVAHNCSDLMTKNLGRSIEKKCNAAERCHKS